MKDLINLYTREDIINRIKLEPEILAKWEKYGLLYPAGYYDKDTPYYNEENFIQAEKLKSLMDLGYDYDALKKITNKIGLPGGNKKKKLQGKLLTVGEIAERSGISTRTLKYWEEKELISPDARSEGGFRLYRESFIEICYRIKELQLFGYTVEELKDMNLLLLPDNRLQEEILTYTEEEIEKSLKEFSTQQRNLLERINELKKAVKRWEGITKVQAKFIHRFKSQIKAKT
ncbi:MAG: HTH-type transcriptional regulator ZntR [bacterium ADurb.Bin363]|nr:MAG: HTH-type transcriptional regulator ZntR [bacterium ADurb.Bin363]